MPRLQACSVCGTEIVFLESAGLGEARPFRLDADGEWAYAPAVGRVRRLRDGEAVAGARFRLHWPCPEKPPGAATTNGQVEVTVVPHTHWDREWYLPFQSFRLHLVRLVDELLDLLKADPGYTHFLLDGQTAALDDYLEVRPEREADVRALGRAGRLASGPWVTLADEFLVSGETLVRDLQQGIARATDLLGAPMQVGYSPDSFGHVAQLPQLLRLAGIRHALVWRGVPLAIDTTAFRWQAPDGSEVRAEYLPHGYSQGWLVPDGAAELLDRLADYDLVTAGQRVGGLLVMDGGDHMDPHASLARVVAEANRAQQRYRIRIGALEDYLAAEPVDGLPVWRGELRSSGRTCVLMGVASNRVDVKLATAAAERAVERYAEPLAALLLPATRYPHRLLGHAWRRLLLNAAHDSSCACSHDEVDVEVLDRYHQAQQVGTGLATEAVDTLAAGIDAPPGSTLVANPTGRPWSAPIVVRATGAGPWHVVDHRGTPLPTQADPVDPVPLVAHRLTLAGLPQVRALAGNGTFGEWRVARAELTDDEDAVELRLHCATGGEPAGELDPVWTRLQALAEAAPTRAFVLVVLAAPEWELHALPAQPVPALGWSTYRAVRGAGPDTARVTAKGRTMSNGQVAVAVDTSDGTWSVARDGLEVTGLGRHVDGGDGGDTYNWSPPTVDRLVDRPDRVHVEAVASGPLVARLRVLTDYRWPAYAVGDACRCTRRSDEGVAVQVETVLELRADEPFVRVRTAWDNRARDHRLRVHLPLPAPVDRSAADSAYAVVERGLVHEGNPYEAALATYPARSFVDCSDGRVGLAVVHDGVVEYEVVEGGAELALTLVRSVGYLSRSGMALRPGPAGPLLATPGAQVPGRNERRYAVLLHRGDWRDADLYGVAARVLVPPMTARVPGGGALPPTGDRLRAEGLELTAVLRDEDGRLVVRGVRTDAHAGPVRVWLDGSPARGHVVDLTGRVLRPFRGELDAAPWQVLTLRVDDRRPAARQARSRAR